MLIKYKFLKNNHMAQKIQLTCKNSEPVYGDNDRYIKTKIKVYGDRVNTNFQGKKVSKENASDKCLSLIMLDSVIRVNIKYYPQTRKNKKE